MDAMYLNLMFINPRPPVGADAKGARSTRPSLTPPCKKSWIRACILYYVVEGASRYISGLITSCRRSAVDVGKVVLVRRAISLCAGEPSVGSLGVLRMFNKFMWKSVLSWADFSSSFFAGCTARTARPLLLWKWGELVTCSKFHSLENVPNSFDVNCDPLSVMSVLGTPSLAKCCFRLLITPFADMSLNWSTSYQPEYESTVTMNDLFRHLNRSDAMVDHGIGGTGYGNAGSFLWWLLVLLQTVHASMCLSMFDILGQNMVSIARRFVDSAPRWPPWTLLRYSARRLLVHRFSVLLGSLPL